MLSYRAGAPWLLLVVLLISAAVYLPSLSFRFVYDDTQQIVGSRSNLTWRAVPGYFTSDVWGYSGTTRTNYYRPIFLVWLMLNYQLYGFHTVFWHLTALLAHLAATLLLYFLALRLVRDSTVAGVAALLFGVHPAHVESVTWISGATETLFAICGFAAILCHLNWREESRPRRRLEWRFASLVLFAVALLAKETAVVVPCLIAAWEWLFPVSPAGAKNRLKDAALAVIPFAPIVALYVLLRVHALGSVAPVALPWPPGSMIATWPLALSYYFRQLLLPIQYSIVYPVQPVQVFGLANYLIPMLVVVCAAAVLIWLSRRSRTIAFSALLLLLPLLPVLNLRAFSLYDFIHDRYLYVPSAGLCIMLALAWKNLRASRARTAETLLFAVVAVLAVIAVHTSFYWRNDNILFEHAIRVAPDNPMAQLYWGKELMVENRCVESLPMIKSALAGLPDSGALYNDLAFCHAKLNDVSQAISDLHDAMALRPDDPAAYINLGMVEFEQGRLDDAERHLQQALRLRARGGDAPAFVNYHLSLGKILEAKGDLRGALSEYRAELLENPSADGVRDLVTALSARLGRLAP